MWEGDADCALEGGAADLAAGLFGTGSVFKSLPTGLLAAFCLRGTGRVGDARGFFSSPELLCLTEPSQMEKLGCFLSLGERAGGALPGSEAAAALTAARFLAK